MLKFLFIAAVLFVLYKIVAAVTEKSKDRKFEKFKEEQAAVAEKNRAEKQAKIQRQLTSVKDFRTGRDVGTTCATRMISVRLFPTPKRIGTC